MLGNQTTELYSNFARTKEVNNVFKATESEKSLQFLTIIPNIIKDLLVMYKKSLFNERAVESNILPRSLSANGDLFMW